ncbi:concanavalin A-like lectin/glucanase domain-containing protein [Crassisporium funariophilum]|nr:concanavalin A-like lectin/glucanase domain-containing protein [Crassisporium funariophilum]
MFSLTIGLVVASIFTSQLGLKHVNAFNVAQDYSGATFFNEWDFYGKYDDLTLGDVIWVDRDNATSKKLAYVNSAGNAIIKVDNTTNVPWNEKRDTVRITTKREYGVGTIWIADIIHLPFGCSVWPAMWTKGHNWPDDGEIDIIEGINLMDHNQMALHTKPGCTHTLPQGSPQRGKTLEADCSKDAGCTVAETAPNSFGEGFNNAGGGVFATQFDATGIYIWFWGRASIPPSILSATSTSPIDSLADWGPPAASYPAISTCDISAFFSAQSLILDITLCGAWAGLPSQYTPQCGARGTTGKCYDDNVVGTGDNYDNAYFEIKYVRAYVDPNAVQPTTTTNTGGGATRTTSNTIQTPGSSTGSSVAVGTSSSSTWIGMTFFACIVAAIL